MVSSFFVLLVTRSALALGAEPPRCARAAGSGSGVSGWKRRDWIRRFRVCTRCIGVTSKEVGECMSLSTYFGPHCDGDGDGDDDDDDDLSTYFQGMKKIRKRAVCERSKQKDNQIRHHFSINNS
ncbi:hypothetical protein QTP70_005918 [Hemibagrus guttatus]|uniref:Secreted protein n=1 Tax=Hemibagrus guttatus TaxID=175788 RepID=A0AAE0PYQ9_9TELE|nr:hypothetical protein QTP70_005918 [Hemibagrus guttatus]